MIKQCEYIGSFEGFPLECCMKFGLVILHDPFSRPAGCPGALLDSYWRSIGSTVDKVSPP